MLQLFIFLSGNTCLFPNRPKYHQTGKQHFWQHRRCSLSYFSYLVIIFLFSIKLHKVNMPESKVLAIQTKKKYLKSTLLGIRNFMAAPNQQESVVHLKTNKGGVWKDIYKGRYLVFLVRNGLFCLKIIVCGRSRNVTM